MTTVSVPDHDSAAVRRLVDAVYAMLSGAASDQEDEEAFRAAWPSDVASTLQVDLTKVGQPRPSAASDHSEVKAEDIFEDDSFNDVNDYVKAEIGNNGDEPLLAEVVGFRNERILLMPLGEMHGIQPGSPVYPNRTVFRMWRGARAAWRFTTLWSRSCADRECRRRRRPG